ncbi:MAG: diguanylate cyclase [Rhodanobacter sp.]
MLYAVLVLWALCVGLCHADVPLNGAWREVRAGDTPHSVLAEFHRGGLNSFDPAQLQRFPRSKLGSWVVLQTQPSQTGEEHVLSLYPSPPGRVIVYGSQGPVGSLALDDFDEPDHAHGELAWWLAANAPTDSPILLKLEPMQSASAPLGFRLQTLSEYLRQDARWLMFASACFAVMLAMGLLALCLALMLRDVTYAWYAGYILCYGIIQGVHTGFLFHPLELDWLAGTSALTGDSAAAMSVAFAALFVVRFCDLPQHVPLLSTPVTTLAVGMLLVTLLRVSHIEPLTQVGQILIHPLLILGALLLTVASLAAAWRGAHHAWFFLAGWAPLLVLTAMASAQSNGTLPGIPWLDDASLAAGAFEAIVVSLGLADRALNVRRDRDHVRVLADHDAMTRVLNRRAWCEVVGTIIADRAVGERASESMALLFLDLDHFKLLNDHRGHRAGDQALVAVADALRHELRPPDLLGRYGGEEFVAMLHGVTQEQAMQVATRLCRRVHRLEIPVDGNSRQLSISIGLAMYHMGDTVDSWVERADHAMYAAKAEGRNRVRTAEHVRVRPHLKAVE